MESDELYPILVQFYENNLRRPLCPRVVEDHLQIHLWTQALWGLIGAGRVEMTSDWHIVPVTG